MTTNLRIHPAIGFARVGNSDEYYLQPQTIASLPQKNTDVTGGLPIVPGTDDTTITSKDIRDSDALLKRQGARFRIYQYQDETTLSYPSNAGEEVKIGSSVGGKIVKNIIWTVHLANKKANCWEIDEDANLGIRLYEDGQTPPIRNPNFAGSKDPADKTRLQKLVADAGPRTISSATLLTAVKFNKKTTATYWGADNKITELNNYPQSYPATENNTDPATCIDYLGEMFTESDGRLVVLGGFGKACGFDQNGNVDANASLDKDVDNNNWLDDTADGPVTAVLEFECGSYQVLKNSAWVVSTDPAYAPQTLNAVSLWDDIYATWLDPEFNINPALFKNGSFQDGYVPDFEHDVFPSLRAANMQMWNTNLPEKAIKSHQRIDELTKAKPAFNIMSFIRKPTTGVDDHLETGAPLMPLSLGDADKSFMTLTDAQYFLMDSWSKGACDNDAVPTITRQLSEGEALDKAVLMNCLGGRFSPGIDLTFIVRDPDLYNKDWTDPSVGPFRINREIMDYASAEQSTPFLGVGYTPLRSNLVQPGDLCKFMSIPWHTDYNSCATHTPAPNPSKNPAPDGTITENNIYSGNVNTTLFWSWPAQRPVAVYTFDDLSKRDDGTLPAQRYSVRGEGTSASNEGITFFTQEDVSAGKCTSAQVGDLNNSPASNVGRYQNRKDILDNWHNIGTIVQGAVIDSYPDNADKNYYLEVQSNFKTDESNLVEPWVNTVTDKVYAPEK
jgi:hypothetical protein